MPVGSAEEPPWSPFDEPGDGAGPRAAQHPTSARACARVGCSSPAEHTLTADYEDRAMAVGPLSPVRMPPALDLCGRHREALAPPDGWRLISHDPSRE